MLTQDGLRSITVEGARSATGDETRCPGSKAVRFSAQKKMEVVLRLLRGEALDLVSRELQVPAARLASWRDAFLTGGQGAMKNQPGDGRDHEIARLRETLGESTRENELLREKIAWLETGRPLQRRRSSR